MARERGKGRGFRRLMRLGVHDGWTTRRDVDDEIRLHIELRTEQLIAEGLDPARAVEEARRLFAVDDQTLRALYGSARERSRRMRFRERAGGWWRDVKYAARGLWRDRLASGFVAVTLALGMGAALTAFTLVDRLLLRDPAHVRSAGEVVRLYGTVASPSTGEERTASWIPYGPYRALRDQLTTVAPVGGYRVTERRVGRGLDARRLRVAETMDAYFQVLGTSAVAGRLFGPAEDAAGAGPLAILSERVWWQDYRGAPSAIGAVIEVEDVLHTIVGVAPAGFSGIERWRVDVWVLGDSRRAGTTNWNIIGRLRPGVTVGAVSAEADAIMRRSGDASPVWYREARLSATHLGPGDDGREPFEATMARWLVMVAVLILAVALGNVANLLLARVARRRRELAVRVALGSGRGGMVRLLAVEGALLTIAGALLGLVVLAAVEPVVAGVLMDSDVPWSLSLVDPRVLAALLALILLGTAAVAAAPAIHEGGDRLTAALRSGAHGGAERSGRTRSGLTILQAALSVVLLVGAGLFLRSMARADALDLGFDRDRVLTVTAELPSGTRYAGEIASFRRARDAVAALPGVEAAAVAVGFPLDGGRYSAAVGVPGRDSVPALPGGGPYASAVGPGYFEAVGTTLLRGRGFTDADGAGSEPVLVINEAMAGTIWPDDDPLDRCLELEALEGECARVVGIAADVHRVGLHDRASMQYYMPLEQQEAFGGAILVVRTAARGPAPPAAIQRAVLAADPAIRLARVRPLTAELDDELRFLRLGMVVFGLSSLLALVVAVLGLYSVLAYMVAWRTREIGVRSALGATRTDITALVIRAGGRLTLAGVVLGSLLSLVASRWLEPHLFRTSGADPLVFASVAATILAVAAVAGWLPARRAARVSPTEALRSD